MFDTLQKDWKNFCRRRDFEAKIRNVLPNYHPETGGRLSWDIEIRCKKTFNYKTGTAKQIGLSTLKINQNPPSCLRDDRVYIYDWHNKQIVKMKGLRWA